MHPYTQKLMDRFYENQAHPYRIYSRLVSKYARQGAVLVDLGCGRGANQLKDINLRDAKLIGLDLVDFTKAVGSNRIYLIKNSIDNVCLRSDSVNLAMCRSVLEHIQNPLQVFQEVRRILKQGGHFVFLTPNIGDYSTIVSRTIPNRYHPVIVARTEGRDIDDTFPAYYKCNSHGSIKQYAKEVGFSIEHFAYLGQYPAYLTFNPILFFLGTIYDKLICRYNAFKRLRGWILVVLRK